MFVLVGVFPNGKSRITATSDVDSLLRQWRKRHGAFVPVAAFECDTAAFCEAAQLPRLPKTVSTSRAAELLRFAPVAQPAQRAVFRQIATLGAEAGPILAEWVAAVRAAAVNN